MVERATLQRIARGIEALAIQALKEPFRIVWVEKGESAAAAVSPSSRRTPAPRRCTSFSWSAGSQPVKRRRLPPPAEQARVLYNECRLIGKINHLVNVGDSIGDWLSST